MSNALNNALKAAQGIAAENQVDADFTPEIYIGRQNGQEVVKAQIKCNIPGEFPGKCTVTVKCLQFMHNRPEGLAAALLKAVEMAQDASAIEAAKARAAEAAENRKARKAKSDAAKAALAAQEAAQVPQSSPEPPTAKAGLQGVLDSLPNVD